MVHTVNPYVHMQRRYTLDYSRILVTQCYTHMQKAKKKNGYMEADRTHYKWPRVAQCVHVTYSLPYGHAR